MSSSITTAVPSGLITTDWCIQDSVELDGSPRYCRDSRENPSDFGTICCDGEIVDTTSDVYRYGNANNTIDLGSLVCCRVEGPQQQGGLQPIATNRAQCTQGSPTPLASLAATNIRNAAPWEKTFTSASQSIGPSTTIIGDHVILETPRCLWVYTKTGVELRSVTVPAADITTYSGSSTNATSQPTATRSSAATSAISSSSVTDSATSASSITSTSASSTDVSEATTSATDTSGAASAHGLNPTLGFMMLIFGVARLFRL